MKGKQGFNEVLKDFINAFDMPELTNIGLIVDADFDGVEQRKVSVLDRLSKKLKHDYAHLELTPEGLNFDHDGITIGIWIMPDNEKSGYFEHFLEKMVKSDDDILAEAKSKVEDLLQKDYCRYKPKDEQKAIIRTWLAWQENPGNTFGKAIKSGYLDINSAELKPFLSWISKTFAF